MSQVAWPLADHMCIAHHAEVILPTIFVENKLSDMHFLLTRVRHNRSFTLSIGFLLSEYTYPIRHFPNVTTRSIDQIRNSVLIRFLSSSTLFPLTLFPLLTYVAIPLYK